MRQHPAVSADIIAPLFPEELVAAVRHHHERWDGAGYPDGLAGDDIPLIARAMCVVDSYDAMSLAPPVPQARAPTWTASRSSTLQRRAVRPGDHGRVPARARRARGAARLSRARGRRRPRRASTPPNTQARLADGDEERPEYAEIAADPARGARRQSADPLPDHPGRLDGRFVIGRRRRGRAAQAASPRRARTSWWTTRPARCSPARAHRLQRPVRRRLRRVGQRHRRRAATATAQIVAAVVADAAGSGLATPAEGLRSQGRRDAGLHAADGGRAPEPGRDRRDHRRPHRSLQPPLSARAPRGGDRASRASAAAPCRCCSATSTTSRSSTTATATPPATTRCARRRAIIEQLHRAGSTWRRATAARSSSSCCPASTRHGRSRSPTASALPSPSATWPTAASRSASASPRSPRAARSKEACSKGRPRHVHGQASRPRPGRGGGGARRLRAATARRAGPPRGRRHPVCMKLITSPSCTA